MIVTIPMHIYDSLLENPEMTGAEIAFQFGIPSRTARHYRESFASGNGKRRISTALTEWQEDIDLHEFDICDYIQQARADQKEKERDDPSFQIDTWDFGTDKPVAICFMSCAHIAGRYTNYEEFEKVYNLLKNDDRIYLASLGDEIEGFIPTFYSVEARESQLDPVQKQRVLIREILMPFKDRILCGCASQHGSHWTRRSTGEDHMKKMYLEDFKAPYFEGMAYINAKVGTQNYWIALSHEFKGSSMTNVLYPQQRAWRTHFPSADVVVAGDRHTPAMATQTAFVTEYDAGLRASPNVTFIQAGTLKDKLDSYTIRNFSRGVSGWPFIILNPNTHEVKTTFDYEDVQQWLK